MKILYAEDEHDLREVTAAYLELQGHTVTAVCNGLEAVEKSGCDAYDILVMDIMMPLMDGITAMKQIREKGNTLPAIFLTAKGEISDRVEGLDAGADDYLTKPFAMEELNARLRALQRRKRDYRIRTLSFSNLELDTETGELRAQNTIGLAQKEVRLVRPLAENDERQKRFITNASHELKTPLAVISANTEMTEALGGRSKWTDSTRRQVKRMQTLIEDLVVLARLDETKEMEQQDVHLTKTVSDAAESFRSVVESSGRTFITDLENDLFLKGDQRGIQQLCSILMDNASKYCDEGGTVSVRLHKKSRGGAELIVSNTYAAGRNEDLEHIFERFYRQDESHHSGTSGFGIGLSMAREITERMKGKLNVSYAGDTIAFTAELSNRG